MEALVQTPTSDVDTDLAAAADAEPWTLIELDARSNPVVFTLAKKLWAWATQT
jgi:hypothetical protein